MKSTTTIFGIVLIVVGILGLSYQGFTYMEHEQVAKIGDVQITADHPKSVYFPPLLGGLSLAVGIALVVIGRINKN